MAFIYDQFPDVERQIACARETGKVLNDAARQVQRAARSGADLPGQARKKFRKNSIRYWTSRVRTVDGVETQAAFVSSWDNLAVVFEFGSIWMPPLRTLTNASRAAGLRFEETPVPGAFDIGNIAGSESEITLSGGYDEQVPPS